MLNSMQAKPMYEGTVEEARASTRASLGMRDPDLAPDLPAVEDISVAGAAGDLPARVYRPVLEGRRPTIAYFHGGGFVVGDLDTIDLTCRNVAVLCDAVVVSVDYRLAPEHRAPAAAQDAIAAAIRIADHLDALGGSDVLGVAGDSAGGSCRPSWRKHSATRAARWPGSSCSTPSPTSPGSPITRRCPRTRTAT
ncbi:MAG TPA: alpha/beta hydrolase [Solirubrobacteraceae bacterium]|nr:alpha/beta hydrolase [Solirubrobacteraceae bacterium]